MRGNNTPVWPFFFFSPSLPVAWLTVTSPGTRTASSAPAASSNCPARGSPLRMTLHIVSTASVTSTLRNVPPAPPPLVVSPPTNPWRLALQPAFDLLLCFLRIGRKQVHFLWGAPVAQRLLQLQEVLRVLGGAWLPDWTRWHPVPRVWQRHLI